MSSNDKSNPKSVTPTPLTSNSENEDSRSGTCDISKLIISADKKRKSAFQPYKPSNTVLTNLQRGNTEASIGNEICLNFHELSAQGEITEAQAANETNIDTVDINRFTPLHWACHYGQLNSTEILIKHGADVNRLALDYVSPLLLAAAGGHHEIVRFLLNSGADVNHMDIAGNTALMYAAAGNHPHTCNEILSHHPKIMDSNEDGDTAYSLAVENSSILAQAVIENYMVNALTSPSSPPSILSSLSAALT